MSDKKLGNILIWKITIFVWINQLVNERRGTGNYAIHFIHKTFNKFAAMQWIAARSPTTYLFIVMILCVCRQPKIKKTSILRISSLLITTLIVHINPDYQPKDA